MPSPDQDVVILSRSPVEYSRPADGALLSFPWVAHPGINKALIITRTNADIDCNATLTLA